MPISKQKEIEMEERRAKIAELTLKGVPQVEIARRLGMNTSSGSRTGAAKVSQELKKIRAEWKESTLQNYDALKARQLAEIALLKRELWQAWEDSKVEQVTTTTQVKRVPCGLIGEPAQPPESGEEWKEGVRADEDIYDMPVEEGGVAEGEADREENNMIDESQVRLAIDTHTVTTVNKSRREGNPAFTTQILNCIAHENELMGLVAEAGEVSTSPPVIAFRIHASPEVSDTEEREVSEDKLLPGPEETSLEEGDGNRDGPMEWSVGST